MTTRIDYENMLNPAQHDAVMTLGGPILVIAGAGSGKTRTLVYRVARLVESGVDPESILLLTFTRKAAQEMLDRAAGLSDSRCRFVSGGTFHSLAHRVLRSKAPLLGFDTGFTILDRSDMEDIVQGLVSELEVVKGVGRFPKRSTLANILSKAANVQRPIEEIMLEEFAHFLHVLPTVERLADLYAGYKRRHQMMDYDDLISNLLTLLEEHDDVRGELSRRYAYIMVDEYQDTNGIQAEIVRWMGREHRNVMVVGDDSQAIYSFRGANYRNMFDFPTYFPEVKTIKLEENYRSTQPILTFTNALMAQAQEQYTKCLFTRREDGLPPKVIDTRTEPEQAMFICEHIREEIRRGRSMRDFAVLFRAAYHSFELEVELARRGIPFVKYGGFKFMESAHIKDFLAHLRVIAHRDDILSWTRILRLIPHIGQAKSNAILDWIRTRHTPPGAIDTWPGAGKGAKGLGSLSGLLRSLSQEEMAPEKAVERVMAYYTPILEQRFDDYPKRQKELERLLPMAARYKRLRSFLDDLALDPPNSSLDVDAGQKKELLTLSTVHSAKGLEWSVVFILWVMEGRFPPAHAYRNPLVFEEERRLMYVAATRAKDVLILCYPGREVQPAWQMAGAGVGNGLSTFIQSLPSEVVAYESMGPAGRVLPGAASFGTHTRPAAHANGAQGLCPGDRVTHPAFGPGVVSKLVDQDKVEVLFRDWGRKLLHMAHTSLEKR